MQTTQVEVWVVVDESGDYAVGKDAEAVAQQYADEIGADDSTAKRLVKVTLTVPLPAVAELVGTVAAEPTAGELKAV